MTKKTTCRVAWASLTAAFAFLTCAAPVWAQNPPQRSITQLGDSIYRVQNGLHFSIFIVGPKNILATDPIDADTAGWLRAELRQRFGPKPIKFLVYSHNHPDHVTGGQALADSDTFIVSHYKAAADLRRNKAPTAYPNLTFSDRLWLDLDGRAIELRYHGPNNGAGSISLYVPDAKFLYVVDWIVLKRLPARDMFYYNFEGMIDSVKEVLEIDFNLISPGHSVVGTKADVRDFLTYLETLRDEVLKGMNEGKTLSQMQKDITLDSYSNWGNFEYRLANIKGAYDQLVQTSARYGQATPPAQN